VSTILFVDDDPSIRLLVSKVLESDGHEVELAEDGPGALARLNRRLPDLAILDLSMPGMSGLEVCESIKTNPATSHIPVLMLTAQSEVDDKVAGFEAGADDYLAKPFAVRELSARVTALLRLVRRETDRNPTSGLPGGSAIEEEIDRRVAERRSFAICYIDLDNFKPFADTFGFFVADKVIRDTAAAIRDAVSSAGSAQDFVGHIGGDDFIAITTEEFAEPIARACAARFRDVIIGAIGEDAVQSGTFTGDDREGRAREFAVATLSTVVLLINPDHWVSVAHLGAFAAEMKRAAKQQGSSALTVQAV
jgi:PleD family two-component response regulator